jgi:hypothetical protein
LSRGEWAGYPLPQDDLKLVVEPGHPMHERMNGMRFGDGGVYEDVHAEVAEQFGSCDSIHVLNWWRRRDGRFVYVWHNGDGKSRAAVFERCEERRRVCMYLNTLSSALVFELGAEQRAQESLAELVGPHRMALYATTSVVMETSSRSRLTYLFRRGRPTLVIKLAPDGTLDRPICCLCLHPIGYYQDSWSGVMVPTDEVIAHLLLMRGDEAYYWRKANQHPVDSIEAGL